MSDDKKRFTMAMHDNDPGHPLAFGLIAGAAIGVGVGLLFAPRKGADFRKQMGRELSHVKDKCESGLSRAKHAAGDWADRGRHVYDDARELVNQGAHETQQYVRDVADAVTMRR